MSSHEVSARNRAERRLAAKNGKRAQAVGAALTARSAAPAMGATWIGRGVEAADAATTLHVTTTDDAGAGSLRAPVRAGRWGRPCDLPAPRTIPLRPREVDFNKHPSCRGPGAAGPASPGTDNPRIFDV